MEVEVVQTRAVILTLTEKEAAWLHAHVQNGYEGETSEDLAMRKMFFDNTDIPRLFGPSYG